MNKARIIFLSIFIATSLGITPIAIGNTSSWDKVKKTLLSKPGLAAIGSALFFGIYVIGNKIEERNKKKLEEEQRLHEENEKKGQKINAYLQNMQHGLKKKAEGLSNKG